ncbi:hypothetical protein Poli38472_011244 [Pythium oligandrum]|uniref:Uncharacterized protein n=1 Tax=Pythium oligandrum TaxID=41045 RepID=A0A8K1CQX9_PYTOL|nr:hypothetical protein Poli38472_011244 [Pythium oligandrum]|eukprot:TMW67624.1 hypothetical protein Poli38472_011244 [Pythium oligandrum]
MQWYRLSEVRRSVAVESHWKRCLKHVLRCISWKSHDQVEVEFPIQFRQARMLIFRTFAIFYGLLSVRLQTDLSLKLVFVNARSSQKISLILPEKQIVSCLGEYRDKLTMASTRKVFYAQVCEKLFFEYTSRGYELLFPGVKAKGIHRRHPLEVSVLEKHQEELEQEHQRLRLAMSQCVEQAAIIARRRMEQYHERMRRLKKIRQQQAVRKIQAHSRTLIAKIQFRRQQDEQRRMSQLENFAAQVIQHHVRKRTELERQLRLRQIKHRDTHGTRFRFACRINGSFLLVLVTLDEIDRATNSVDCNVSVVHPVTSQAALTRVPYEELMQLTGEASLSHWSRRDIVEALVRHHLNVFRSAKHRVLVVTTV